MKYATSFGEYSKVKYNINEHKDYEIIYYTSGVGKSQVNGNFFEVQKGTIVIVPPKVKHGSISLDNLSYSSIVVNNDGLIRTDNYLVIKDNDRCDGFWLMQMIQENRYGDEEYFNSLCLAFIHFVLKNVEILTPIEKTVNEIKNKIAKNFHDSEFDVTKLLNESGYTEDYIRSLFKKIVGETPIEYLTKLRIKHAKTLINIYQNSMPLIDISINCGFDDYIYFSRKFKQIVGVSPKSYEKSILIEKK